MADFKDRLGDYKDVPARVADFKEKHPEGTLRPLDPANPYRIESIDGKTYVVFVAAAFRTPDDPAPGVGTAWEPFPGRTPYTKDSELQNAETSAWGRAIVACLASESKQIASAEDVRNRQADEEVGPVMAPKSAVHALVESVKDTPVATPLKAWLAEHDLSFTQPLTLDQFNAIKEQAEKLSSAGPDEPASHAAGGGSRAEVHPPPSAPAAESSTSENQGDAPRTVAASNNDAPAGGVTPDDEGSVGEVSPSSSGSNGVLQLLVDLQGLKGRARAEAMGEKTRLKITDVDGLDPESEQFKLLRAKVSEVMA